MTQPLLSIRSVQRQLWNGNVEALTFEPGVNLITGPPNTGKTNWLRIIDYLFGDSAAFEAAFDEDIVEKYDAASAVIAIGDETFFIERRWKEAGAKTKIFVDQVDMTVRDFQHFLMLKLEIPLLHFPKGNPLSGQTWPELSFRMLLRHIYRQQHFWGNLADQQPEGEQHACLLHFLGLAERIFTVEYGELVGLKIQVDRLKARRDQYGLTLDELARDVISEPNLQVSATMNTIGHAEEQIIARLTELGARRQEAIRGARDNAVVPAFRSRIEELSQQRASLIVGREELDVKSKAVVERLADMRRYQAELNEELERLHRAEDAGSVLADLKITHCPACDQAVAQLAAQDGHCHLCNQSVPDNQIIEELGATRLRFERDRLSGELQEANTLVELLKRDHEQTATEQKATEERLRMVANELAPARLAISALVQEDLSAIDMELGELNERQRQVRRLRNAVELGDQLNDQIGELENRIEPLQDTVDRLVRAIDFGKAEELLSDGINEYLLAINALRPQTWRHSDVTANFSRSSFSLKVGSKRWSVALGGTDTLYFLMAYHYGLLALSVKSGCHYPGVSIIDLPGDFLGEAVEDKENFIIQPFIDLLARKEFAGGQLIITGASFQALANVHRERLTRVFVV